MGIDCGAKSIALMRRADKQQRWPGVCVCVWGGGGGGGGGGLIPPGASEGRTPRRQEAQKVWRHPAMATSRGASKQMSHSPPATLAALGALRAVLDCQCCSLKPGQAHYCTLCPTQATERKRSGLSTGHPTQAQTGSRTLRSRAGKGEVGRATLVNADAQGASNQCRERGGDKSLGFICGPETGRPQMSRTASWQTRTTTERPLQAPAVAWSERSFLGTLSPRGTASACMGGREAAAGWEGGGGDLVRVVEARRTSTCTEGPRPASSASTTS